MNRVRWERLAWIALTTPLLALPSACVVDPGYGYGGGSSVSVGLDYYEPLGFDYGGWGRNYRSGPPRGEVRSFRDGGGAAAHAYRSAPAGRAMPSLPSGSRGGGGRR
jgi:hypothetical protein